MAQRSACYSHLLLHLVAGLRCGHCQLSNHHDDVSLNKTRHKRLKDSQFHNFATASRTLQSTFGSCVRSNGQDHGQATMRESGTGAHRARPGVHVPHQRRGPVALTAAIRALHSRCCTGPANICLLGARKHTKADACCRSCLRRGVVAAGCHLLACRSVDFA